MSDETKSDQLIDPATGEPEDVEVLEKRYSPIMGSLGVPDELMETEPTARELYKRKILREFDSDAEKDTVIPAQIKKILRRACEKEADGALTTDLPGFKEKYLLIRSFYKNHLTPMDLKKSYSDMPESNEAEAMRIMKLYGGVPK